MTNENEYAFYLWVEYLRMYNNWLKWWEDLCDLYWVKKLSED